MKKTPLPPACLWFADFPSASNFWSLSENKFVFVLDCLQLWVHLLGEIKNNTSFVFVFVLSLCVFVFVLMLCVFVFVFVNLWISKNYFTWISGRSIDSSSKNSLLSACTWRLFKQCHKIYQMSFFNNVTNCLHFFNNITKITILHKPWHWFTITDSCCLFHPIWLFYCQKNDV